MNLPTLTYKCGMNRYGSMWRQLCQSEEKEMGILGTTCWTRSMRKYDRHHTKNLLIQGTINPTKQEQYKRNAKLSRIPGIAPDVTSLAAIISNMQSKSKSSQQFLLNFPGRKRTQVNDLQEIWATN